MLHENIAHVDGPEGVYDVIKLLLLDCLQFNIHAAKLALFFELFAAHPFHNSLQVQHLLCNIEPRVEDWFGKLLEFRERQLDNDLSLHMGTALLLARLSTFSANPSFCDLLFLSFAFVMFVKFHEPRIFLQKVLSCEYSMQILYDPIFVKEQEVSLDSFDLEIFMVIVPF